MSTDNFRFELQNKYACSLLVAIERITPALIIRSNTDATPMTSNIIKVWNLWAKHSTKYSLDMSEIDL